MSSKQSDESAAIREAAKKGDWFIYAYTPNGREIRAFEVDAKTTRYQVQPKNDNYWITTKTPEQALKAYHHPEKFQAS